MRIRLLLTSYCTSDQSDETLTDGTVLVDWVGGQEAYTAICSGELTLRYDADTNAYETADGLIWKTEGALPFATYQPLLMPRTREELLQYNAIYAALQDASGFWSEEVTGTEVLPVYAAPDENSYRASNGKASVSLAGSPTRSYRPALSRAHRPRTGHTAPADSQSPCSL